MKDCCWPPWFFLVTTFLWEILEWTSFLVITVLVRLKKKTERLAKSNYYIFSRLCTRLIYLLGYYVVTILNSTQYSSTFSFVYTGIFVMVVHSSHICWKIKRKVHFNFHIERRIGCLQLRFCNFVSSRQDIRNGNQGYNELWIININFF